MKTFLRYPVGLLALAVPLWVALGADEAPHETPAGHVLLLQNEHIIEGEISREGDHYRVRRPLGETIIPGDGVLCLCQTREQAYARLRGCANLRDADERLRLARWCHLYGLKTQALAEAKAALEIRPSSAEYRRFLDSLQRSAALSAIASAPGKHAVPAEPRMPPVDISADTMGLFISRVQPILMNTCASCHVADKGGNFRLIRTEGGSTNHRATQHNLAAVLAEINRAHWQASPLLTKAVSVHGDSTQPPLKSRQTAAFRSLEEWVRTTMENNPQLQEPSASLIPTETPREPRPVEDSAVRPTAFAESNPDSGKPSAAAAQPADPFDPVLFNQMLPRKGRKQDR